MGFTATSYPTRLDRLELETTTDFPGREKLGVVNDFHAADYVLPMLLNVRSYGHYGTIQSPRKQVNGFVFTIQETYKFGCCPSKACVGGIHPLRFPAFHFFMAIGDAGHD